MFNVGEVVTHKFGKELVIVAVFPATSFRPAPEYTCRYLNIVSGEFRTITVTAGEIIETLQELT